MLQPPHHDRLTREAFRLASDLLNDLTAGTQLYYVLNRLFEKNPPTDHVRTAVTRLCLFHTIISLSKWAELYDRYKAIIPPDVREAGKRLRRQIEDRRIVEFRNKCVGHIWDDEQGRALTNAEVQARLDEVTKSDVAGLFAWVNDGKLEDNPNTAVGMIELVRDGIRATYGLTDADLQR